METDSSSSLMCVEEKATNKSGNVSGFVRYQIKLELIPVTNIFRFPSINQHQQNPKRIQSKCVYACHKIFFMINQIDYQVKITTTSKKYLCVCGVNELNKKSIDMLMMMIVN